MNLAIVDLPEDTIEYCIYAFPQKSRAGSGLPETIQQILKDVERESQTLLKKHLDKYLWQRDRFKLNLKTGPTGLKFLYGRSSFGDSMEDEWLIVWLLRLLSQTFPQIWVRTVDNMGEFLLVEAANVLPSWLDPEAADHRVWMNKGGLRIIPVTAGAGTDGGKSRAAAPDPISLEDVRKHVYEEKPTLHPQLVESEAFYRINKYPDQIARNQHAAVARIPRKLAYLLHENPAYVSAALDFLRLEDPSAMRLLKAADTTDLIFPPEDLVPMRTQFTRVDYARLRIQRFAVPPLWQAAVRKCTDKNPLQAMEIGMKVCCGFEMLLSNAARQDDKIVREMKSVLEDVGDGEVSLPSDEVVQSWGVEGDDESWMDVHFPEFERELSGNQDRTTAMGVVNEAFGDQNMQAKLQHIARRFEEFLEEDDDSDIDDSEDSDHEDANGTGSLDGSGSKNDGETAMTPEEEFAEMMREMMGMPKEVMQEIMAGEIPNELDQGFKGKGKEGQ